MLTGADILHVFDPGADERRSGPLADADAADIARVARTLSAYRHHAIVLGSTGGPEHARHVRASPGVLGAGTALRVARRSAAGRSIVHCYSDRAALGARLAFGSRWPILLSTAESAPLPRFDRLSLRGPDETLLHTISPAPGTLPLAGIRLTEPPNLRADLRRALGISPDECVVAAMGHPHAATNARWLVFFAGILVAGGLDLTILVPRGARQIDRMRRFHATTRLNLRVIVADDDTGQNEASAVAACDVAIVRPDAHSAHVTQGRIARSIRRLHAFGVPVITRATDEVAPLYPDQAAEHLLVSSSTTRRVAQSLTRIIESPTLRDTLRRQVRAAALGIVDDRCLASGIDATYQRILARGRASRAAARSAVTGAHSP